MILRPPRSSRTYILFLYTSLFRSLVAERRLFGRNDGEARHSQALQSEAVVQNRARAIPALIVLRKKEVACAIVAVTEIKTQIRRDLAQKYIGLLHQQATAVAGLAIGRDRATMRHACQRGDGGLHELARRLIVHVHDQAEATAVFFKFRPVKTVALVFQHAAC